MGGCSSTSAAAPPVKPLGPDVCTVAFDSTTNEHAALTRHLIAMGESIGATAVLKKTPKDIEAFLAEVEQLMAGPKDGDAPGGGNPYHNFTHICDVTQFMYTMIVQTKFAEVLTPVQRTALFFAAICHDLEHPGLSNTYQVNEKTELAVRYNNESPLENHHLALCRTLMAKHGLLSALTGVDTDVFWSIVKKCILGTDMAKHGTMTKEFDALLADAENNPLSLDSTIEAMRILVKCADISNQARPFDISQTWNEMVYKEFYHEGDLDREAGRDVNPLYNRETNVISKSTIGFITFVVEPLFKLFMRYMDKAKTHDARLSVEPVIDCMQNLKLNKERHQTLVDQVAA